MSLNIAIIGAGMAGITAARTLVQAGHRVQVFEAESTVGGRMASCSTPHGNFDHGTQYFTVRDQRFWKALQTVPGTRELCRPWSVNAVRVLDPFGRVLEAGHNKGEPHFVASPGMQTLVQHWAQPLGAAVHLDTQVHALTRGPKGFWSVTTQRAEGDRKKHKEHDGFDRVLLATPSTITEGLLRTVGANAACAQMLDRIAPVRMAPCWTLMLAFPNASQPNLPYLGPQWNAARSTHHRVSWLARESSKPGRGSIERWTVQASPSWSQEHLQDKASRAEAKLLRAFAELTGIRATPVFTQMHRWLNAKTEVPLGMSHQYHPEAGVGTCGDWHLGHRLEHAFVSGLELALNVCSSAHRL